MNPDRIQRDIHLVTLLPAADLVQPLVMPAPKNTVSLPVGADDRSIREVAREITLELGESGVYQVAKFLDSDTVRNGSLRNLVVDRADRMVNVKWIPARLERWFFRMAFDKVLELLGGLIRWVLSWIADQKLNGVDPPGPPKG